MQDRFQLAINGRELQQADVNLVAKEAALADDRVLAEFMRIVPYNGSTFTKAVVPYGTLAATAVGTVQAGTGAVTINPFRAIVGSRTAVGTLATDNWNDIRSTIFIGSSTTLTFSQTLAANASGNPRWDLVYAAVTVDGNGASVTRYAKDPASKVVAASSTVTTLVTSVAIGVVAGTPGASPAFPTIPVDAAGIYYIPLAFVRVINGFTGATVLNSTDIFEVAPIIPVSRTTGAASLVPASGNSSQSGAVLTSTAFPWTGTTNTRPGPFIPSSMVGQESLLIELDLLNAASANWSHQSLGIVDNSRDWRNRFFKWSAYAVGSSFFAADKNNAVAGVLSPQANPGAPGLGQAVGVGQGFVNDGNIVQTTGAIGAPVAPMVCVLKQTANMSSLGAGTLVALYLDTGTGALKVYVSGVPVARLFIWLEASAPYPNF